MIFDNIGGAAPPKADTTRYTNFEVNAKCFAHTPFSSPHHTNEATNKNQHQGFNGDCN